MDFRPGRHFLQIPGPSPVPDRVLRAMNRAVLDHRGPEFAELGLNVLRDIKPVFGTKSHVIIFPLIRHRCLGGSLGQYLEPGGQSPHV